jgi:hypothetical protein
MGIKWNNLRDWGSDEHMDVRHAGESRFQFVEIIDMNACCGRDNEGHSKYAAELSLVDLAEISPKERASAFRSCGWEGIPDDPAALAEVCYSYGLKAPLWQDSGNNWRKLLAEARREANGFLSEDALAEAMERPVNKLGSTAAEFMRGDLFSAMERGVYAGDTGARIMAKMHGVDQWIIDDARPADFLPYVMGYMAATNGSERETCDDLAPEYNLGYDRGERVRKGDAPAPGWIKQG